MASGDILSDFGINLLEEEIDDVIFQTNEFLTDATFTGSQGPFWWLLVVSPILLIFTDTNRYHSANCDFVFRDSNLKRDKNGTKPHENKVKTTFDRHAPLDGITLSLAKVQICPVKNERFYLFLSSTIVFPHSCITRDNTNAFYAPICLFLNMDMLKIVFACLDNALADCPIEKTNICT